MDSPQTYFALKELGIELRLNADRTRLGVGKRQAYLVNDELRASVREHHDDLIRGELVRRTVAELYSYMHEHGSGPTDPAYDAGRGAFGDDGRHERLNEAWTEEDLDGFKVLLQECLEAGQAAFREARTVATASGIPAVDASGTDDLGLQLPLDT